MRTRSILWILLGGFLALSCASCNPVTEVPDRPILFTVTARPPKDTPVPSTLTTLPNPSPTARRPTKTPLPTFTSVQNQENLGILSGGEAVGRYDLSQKGDLGLVIDAFITDYGHQLVILTGGGIIWWNDHEAGFEATFSTPVESVSGNNITTRTTDNDIVLADYYPRESGSVSLWEIAPEGISHLVKEINEPLLRVITVEFSPDGKILAIGYNNGEIRLFDTDDGAQVCSIEAHHDEVTNLTFSYDARYLASDSWSNDPFTYVFDLTNGQKVATLSTESYEPGNLSFSPDGKLVSATAFDGTHIFSTSNWQDSGVVIAGIWEGIFTCDSQMLMVSYGNALTDLYSISTGQKVGTVEAAPLRCLHRWQSTGNTWQLLSLEIDQSRNIVEMISHTP